MLFVSSSRQPRPLAYLRAAFLLAIVFISTGLHAAYPPDEPSATLDLLLRDAWQKGADKTYLLYMGKTRVPMAPAAHEAFAPALVALARNPTVAAMVLQSTSKAYRDPQLPSADAIEHAGFIHFIHRAAKSGTVKERIYINVHPDHGADVMRFIIDELFEPDTPSSTQAKASEGIPAVHGIVSTKIADPAGLERRADSILIYATAPADVEWALGRLRQYASKHEDHFLRVIPAATRPRLTGVSTAAEPTASLKAGSFGSYLARIAQAASTESPPATDFDSFRSRARKLMAADGVDPDHLDRLTQQVTVSRPAPAEAAGAALER